LADVLVEAVFTSGKSVRVRARACGSSAFCLACGAISGRVHSRYERRLLDIAAGGREGYLPECPAFLLPSLNRSAFLRSGY
jgi:hypothetical protein